jgi:predicted nuclease of predicted toxin-antitoxin system
VKILFDQGTPAPLRRWLKQHTVATAYELGWAELDNGKLLTAAESDFDALVTTDKNLPYQQNFTGRRLAILILPTANWPELRLHEAQIAVRFDRAKLSGWNCRDTGHALILARSASETSKLA